MSEQKLPKWARISYTCVGCFFRTGRDKCQHPKVRNADGSYPKIDTRDNLDDPLLIPDFCPIAVSVDMLNPAAENVTLLT